VDDTVEVRTNDKNDSFSVFLKKQKLPKADGTFVGAEDFEMGGTINIFGRDFFMYL
jgi:hypothetical protein